MKKHLNEKEMIFFIKDLLCLSQTYKLSDGFTIEFTGNYHKVQSEIIKWLNVPGRLNNLKLLGE